MPVNLPNWAQFETSDLGHVNILENALKGYEAARKPYQIRQEEEQRTLANRLLGHQGTEAEIKNKYLPAKSEADIANTEAQTGLYGSQTRGNQIKNEIEEALGMLRERENIANTRSQTRGHHATANRTEQLTPYEVRAKDIENQTAQENLNFLPKDKAIAQALKENELAQSNLKRENPELEEGNQAAKLHAYADSYEAKGNKEKAKQLRDLAHQEELNEASKSQKILDQGIDNLRAFNSLPATAKTRTVAIMAGAGIPEIEFIDELKNGVSFEEQLKKKGYKKSDIPFIKPEYAPSAASITAAQKQESLIKEMNSIDKEITEGLAPYIRKDFGDYSLTQIADALRGDKKDQVGKFLASSALQPEVQAMRLGALNSPVGQRMIDGMIKKSLATNDILKQTLDPETFRIMQGYMNKWIDQAGKVAVQSRLNYKDVPKNSNQALIAVKDNETNQIVYMTKEQMDEANQNG